MSDSLVKLKDTPLFSGVPFAEALIGWMGSC